MIQNVDVESKQWGEPGGIYGLGGESVIMQILDIPPIHWLFVNSSVLQPRQYSAYQASQSSLVILVNADQI